MRKALIFGCICSAAFMLNPLFAFDKEIKTKDFSIILSSPKDFTSGSNDFTLSIKQGDKEINPSDVAVTFIMPEMPGMPKMTQKSSIKTDGNHINGNVSFPHGGTWQVRISFVVDGKKHQAKSSMDF